ncbi:hypothetical protein VTN00DRAFT_6129 [Thermoascus crustaceus]|uniref:uncharacterized protein n=1 Tax=Thermoascus crustaceus TaxID=5088 RepID=UPI0037429DAE
MNSTDHSSSFNNSDSNSFPLSNVLSALGTLIGYIGTEVATTNCINRLLWPQRSYNNFSLLNAWKLALFMPLGGPLHKAALDTVDRFFENGLFRGDRLGHMLGTAFFPDSGMKYQVYEGGACQKEAQVRNGIWVRTLKEMPMIPDDPLKGAHAEQEDGRNTGAVIRQKTTVSHLTLSPRTGKETTTPLIDNDTGPITLRTVMAIIATELTGIGVAVAVTVIWRSAFMVLWLIPLILKLISAMSAVPREQLILNKRATTKMPAQATEDKETNKVPWTKKFCITTGQGFQVIEGPEEIVLPFFRHYGHPERSRWREIIQITVVVALGLTFPVGLICSLIWMPIGLQCVWTGYVLYVTMVMYVYRYAHGHMWATTEERISETFTHAENCGEESRIMFRAGDDCIIIAELVRTAHNSYGEANHNAMKLLSLPPLAPSADSSRSTSNVRSEGSGKLS